VKPEKLTQRRMAQLQAALQAEIKRQDAREAGK